MNQEILFNNIKLCANTSQLWLDIFIDVHAIYQITKSDSTDFVVAIIAVGVVVQKNMLIDHCRMEFISGIFGYERIYR